MNVLPDLYICSHRKKSAPLLPEGPVKYIYTSSKIQKFTKDAKWNKRKWLYSQNKDLSGKCQTLKTFRIISSEMKISLLILSWWCFSCLYIQRMISLWIVWFHVIPYKMWNLFDALPLIKMEGKGGGGWGWFDMKIC